VSGQWGKVQLEGADAVSEVSAVSVGVVMAVDVLSVFVVLDTAALVLITEREAGLVVRRLLDFVGECDGEVGA